MDDVAALHVYKKLGFADTGYIDEAVPEWFGLPDSRNLRYFLRFGMNGILARYM